MSENVQIAIVGGIVTIMGVVMTMIQYWFNKSVDRKMEEKRIEDDARFSNLEKSREQEIIDQVNFRSLLHAKYQEIFGYLWGLWNLIEADRIYIWQPHPPERHQYISMTFEITSPGKAIKTFKSECKNLPMSDWGNYISTICNNQFITHKSCSSINDPRWKADFKRRGNMLSVYCPVLGHNKEWKGILVCEYTITRNPNIDMIENSVKDYSFMIGNILPEHNPEKK